MFLLLKTLSLTSPFGLKVIFDDRVQPFSLSTDLKKGFLKPSLMYSILRDHHLHITILDSSIAQVFHKVPRLLPKVEFHSVFHLNWCSLDIKPVEITCLAPSSVVSNSKVSVPLKIRGRANHGTPIALRNSS